MNEVCEHIILPAKIIHGVFISADRYRYVLPAKHENDVIPQSFKIKVHIVAHGIECTGLCPVVITLSVLNGLYDRFWRVQLNTVDAVSVIPPFQFRHVHAVLLSKILSFFPGESDEGCKTPCIHHREFLKVVELRLE